MALIHVDYQPLGAARDLFQYRGPEVLLSGPAGTGKSRSCLQKLHACADKYPGMRGLIVRKTRESLTQSALITFNSQVLLPTDQVRWYGNTEYRYPNGSVLVTGGLDKASKVMSAEYDAIYIQEATELDVEDWESLVTRNRYGVMPYQQIIADCNPGPSTHWLLDRVKSGSLLMLESRHEDNPALWDRVRQCWTERGAAYMSQLETLTGTRYLRLRKGIWASAEGVIYEEWNPSVHLVSLNPEQVPATWPRYWACDFGYTHPFVWQEWTADPDGRLYLLREIYMTGRLVEDHARAILAITRGAPRPRAIICDHDAEDRMTLERHVQMKTLPAYKAVSPGIQAVKARLRVAGNGKPRLFINRDALVERDPDLLEAHKPISTATEIDGYVWDQRSGQKKGDQPLKENDHGCDSARYLIAFVDRIDKSSRGFSSAVA